MSFTQVQRSSTSRTTIPIGARVRSDESLNPFTADEKTAVMSVTETSQWALPSCPDNGEIRRLTSSVWPSRWRSAARPDQPPRARHCSARADAFVQSSADASMTPAGRLTTSAGE
jgi:hypothetical protein